jgi:serine/threonine-protein kinase
MQSPPTLRELFEAVADLPVNARVAFLDAHCRDATLRLQVERLVVADADSVEPFSGGAVTAAAAIGETDVAQALPPGTRVGPFELVALLGEGGFSTVFHAFREAAGVRQDVALKILHRGLYSPAARVQFRRERQALAQLQHPGIARLIEGGVTDNGLAYIALDLIDGVRITHHAIEQRLDLRARLALFLQVCRAVEAAHRALIVHRDLKPSNVLVTEEGMIKLLDFGIAKLLDSDDETRTGLAAFTPAYAAPEQRSGGLITTATDVYALGILLGELVTGQRLAGSRTPSSQIDTDAQPGVLPASAPATRRQLRGDLDNILLKALAPEPERRYASAGALADDLERMLDRRPVAAHPPSRWYRASKFVQRHRGGVAATALVLLAFLVAFAIALVEGRAARHEADRANAMRDFMFSAFSEAEPSVPRDGAPRITEVVEQAIAKARGDAQMNASVRTELLSELGAVLRAQGRLAQAEETVRWNYAESLRHYGGQDPLTIAAGRELERCLMFNGAYGGARELLDTLLARVPGAESALHSQLLLDSAEVASKQHDSARALRDGAEGLALARASGDQDQITYALNTAGNIRLSANDLPGASQSYRELLAIYEQRYGTQHVKLATLHAALSRVSRRAGDPDAAEREIRAALDIDGGTLPKDDWHHANHLNALTMILLAKRDFSRALVAAQEGLRINRMALGNEHPEVANDLNNVGMLELQMENYPAAAAALREAVDLYGARLGADHEDTATTRANFGVALARSDDRRVGEVEIRHALASLEAAAKPDLDEIAATCEKLIRVALDAGDARAALPVLDELDAVLARMPATPAEWTARSALLRGWVFIEQHDALSGLERLRAAVTTIAATQHPDPQLRVELDLREAAAANAANQMDAARTAAEQGLARLAALRNPPPSLQRLADDVRAQLTIR